MAFRLPPPPFLRRALVRGAVVWLFLRVILLAGSRMARTAVPMPDALLGTPLTALWITALTVGAVRLDMWRQREVNLLRNLGVGFAPLAALVAVASLAGDVALRLVFA